MSALSSFLHPGRAFKKGQAQLDKYYAQSQGALTPYMEQGQQAFDPMFNAMQSLLNPSDLYNEWMSGYEESPYARDLVNRATTEGLDAASAMGLLGSTPALQALQAGRTKILNQDRDNYFDNMMQKYITGAQMAQSLYGSGQNAANQLGQNAMNMGQQSSQMAYGQQAAGGQLMNNLINTGLSAAIPMYGISKMGANAMSGGGMSPWSTGGSYRPMGGGYNVGGY